MGDSKKVVAVFGGAVYEEKGYNLLAELEKACRRDDYIVLALNFAGESAWDDEFARDELMLVKLAEELPLAAVVILMESVTREILINSIREVGIRKGVPVFALDRAYDGCISLTMNYKGGFKNMVRHVVKEHGCRKVNMIAGHRNNPFSDERIDAYKEVLLENGIAFEPERVGYGDFWDRPTRDVMKEFLSRDELPEAIVCANDSMAITACSMLKEAGVKVPEDVIVTGFDGIMSGILNVPALSTVIQDYHSEAETIIEEIHKWQDGDTEPKSLSVDFVLGLHRSCGCTTGNEKDKDVDQMVESVLIGFDDVNWYVRAMNRMMSHAGTLESLEKLPEALNESISMWNNVFHFVGIFSEYAGNEIKEPSGHTYTELIRCEDGQMTGLSDNYSEHVFIPGLERLLDKESKVRFMIVRRLYTAGKTYGYLAEGFERFTNRDIRRSEEFGMFLSTALNIIVNNRQLSLLNQKLVQANKEIEKISVMDYLTGIYNRRGFFMELEKAISEESNQDKWITFFSIDLDGLKLINDNYGHEEGDFAIKMMASAIAHFVSRNGFCARYGGDEFACALVTDENIENMDAETVRSRFDDVLKNKDEVNRKEYAISASVGISTAKIGSGLNIESLINTADERMYNDKMSRKKNRK